MGSGTLGPPPIRFAVPEIEPTRKPEITPKSLTMKSRLLIPDVNPEFTVKLQNAVKPGQVLPVEVPLISMSIPVLSVAHWPEMMADVGSRPVKSNIVRNVSVTPVGCPVAICHTHLWEGVLAIQEPGIEAALITTAAWLGARIE